MTQGIKVALKAHNEGKPFPYPNEAYNVAQGLGTIKDRWLIRHVERDVYGMFGKGKKITVEMVEKYMKSEGK